jgi:uncharacterized Zn finger protein
MAQFSRTWWGQRFITALEKLMDSGRLSRGRSYARNGKVLNFEIKGGLITAQVRGSVNPYFGVYKEPLYVTPLTLSLSVQLIGQRRSPMWHPKPA